MATALYANALAKWASQPPTYTNRIIRINTSEMIEEWMNYKRDPDGPLPRVLVENLRKHAAEGPRVVLILEEIDKLSPNSNRLAKLYEIINAYHEAGGGGQIIVTSNTSPGDLIKIWDQFPGKYGSTIMRRIAQEPWGTVIHFADR